MSLFIQAASKTSGSVLKTPVKLSDEISIIPTKKDKVCLWNAATEDFDWHAFLFQSKEVIDLDDEEEIDDVEKEVIDIDTPKKRKAEDQPQAKKAKVDADWAWSRHWSNCSIWMEWLIINQCRVCEKKCQKE